MINSRHCLQFNTIIIKFDLLPLRSIISNDIHVGLISIRKYVITNIPCNYKDMEKMLIY